MKKLLICLLFLLSVDSFAANRSEEEMQAIAFNHLFANELYANRAGLVVPRQLNRVLSEKSYCIYEATGIGFVVVSRDEAFAPVLGISYSPYQYENMPDGFKWWLTSISERMEGGKMPLTLSVTPRDNFVSTTWGQGDPYNGLCPKIGSSRPPTGCMATGMAQILNYYNFPAQGKGMGTYTVGGETKTVSINKEYRWDRMEDSYTSSSSMLNKVAVQYLMADAGAAANMTYSMSGSSAYLYDAAGAMAENFQYDSLSLHYLNRNFYSDAEWLDFVYNELSQSHPILYGAQDKSYGGHAFVLSGIDAGGKVYVNWGWDGSGDGYYDIADLSPIIDTKSSGYTFDSSQDMVIGFRTPSSLSPYEFMSQWVSDEPYTLRTRDVNLVELGFRSIWNIHFLSFTGVVELYFKNLSGGKDDSLIFHDTDEDGIVYSLYGFEREDGELIKISISLDDLEAGSYKVFLRTKDKRETAPQVVRINGGEYYIDLTKNEDGTIVTSSDAIPEPAGIQNIPAKPAASVRYFDLQGREVNGSTKGLIIRRQGDEVKKVIVR